jgi:hypothetical protein
MESSKVISPKAQLAREGRFQIPMSLASLIAFPSDVVELITPMLVKSEWNIAVGPRVKDVHPESTTVFLWGHIDDLPKELFDLRAQHPNKFIVVGTSCPDQGTWLDALEAGANDYFCGPPEYEQIKWILRLADKPVSRGSVPPAWKCAGRG